MIKPIINTLRWDKGRLYIIDQRYLPEREKIVELKNIRDVWNSIRNLSVRGAPAIGCVAAYGIALSSLKMKTDNKQIFTEAVNKNIEYLKIARPTAYNLFFAVARMKKIVEDSKSISVPELKQRLVKEAKTIYEEDIECCYKIGVNGAVLVKNGMNILTHCNAGGLATSGYGTALAVFFAAKTQKKRFHIFVDETRPVLQGARLTAWELKKAKIPYTLICDNMAGYLMKQGKVDIVVTGADRIARNGDTANKIGTYSLAVLARHHKLDFYVAAPFSTFDFSIKDGSLIPVEERNEDEIRKIKGRLISPSDAPAYNPSFDITPAHLIKGFITENGIMKRPGGWLRG